MDLKSGLITVAALALGGAAAATVAPFLASKAVDTSDTKNWFAAGGTALGLGLGVMYLGRKSPPVALAGGAMAGAGAGFLTLGYANNRLVQQSSQNAAGPLQFGGPSFRGNSGAGSSQSSRGGFPGWSGVPPMSQKYAQRSGMPTRSFT